MNSYERHGYANRADYLESLSKDLGIDIEYVLAAAEILGPSEDFDGLINILEDI